VIRVTAAPQAHSLGTQAHEEGPVNFAHLARAVRRILQINDQLPPERKIRALSMSTGWQPGQTGYAEITQAVEEAKRSGMLVICSTAERVHGFKFHGLGRDPRADPNDFASYRSARFACDLSGVGLLNQRQRILNREHPYGSSPRFVDKKVRITEHGGTRSLVIGTTFESDWISFA
jgi:hypothetical protein